MFFLQKRDAIDLEGYVMVSVHLLPQAPITLRLVGDQLVIRVTVKERDKMKIENVAMLYPLCYCLLQADTHKFADGQIGYKCVTCHDSHAIILIQFVLFRHRCQQHPSPAWLYVQGCHSSYKIFDITLCNRQINHKSNKDTYSTLRYLQVTSTGQ